jgi:hypothetical protein
VDAARAQEVADRHYRERAVIDDWHVLHVRR